MVLGSRGRRHFIAAAALLWGLPALAAAQRTILVVGDSLSAEYGIARGAGWVALLERRLAAEHVPARVVNASISGDTTSGGRSRLPALLATNKPDAVVIELGANDALRGLPLKMTQDNLDAMVKAAQDAGAKVLLVAMQVPPNYGTDYTRRFSELYAQVGRARHVPVTPPLLSGVADAPEPDKLFQADRLHPVAAAHPRILENVWPDLRKLLR
jgi:acyl-CoA thioesterase-1